MKFGKLLKLQGVNNDATSRHVFNEVYVKKKGRIVHRSG